EASWPHAPPRLGDPVLDAPLGGEGTAEGHTRGGPLAQQPEGSLGHPDQAHAVVDTAGAEPRLRDCEPVALTGDQRVAGHPDVVEHDFGVAAMRCVGVAVHMYAAQPVDARPVARYAD